MRKREELCKLDFYEKITQNILADDRKMYATFMDLEKVYDRTNWKATQDVLKM